MIIHVQDVQDVQVVVDVIMDVLEDVMVVDLAVTMDAMDHAQAHV